MTPAPDLRPPALYGAGNPIDFGSVLRRPGRGFRRAAGAKGHTLSCGSQLFTFQRSGRQNKPARNPPDSESERAVPNGGGQCRPPPRCQSSDGRKAPSISFRVEFRKGLDGAFLQISKSHFCGFRVGKLWLEIRSSPPSVTLNQRPSWSFQPLPRVRPPRLPPGSHPAPSTP